MELLNALSAKERTEIDNEREIVEQATVQAMGNNKRGNIVRNELQDELDKITGEGKTIVTADTEEGGYFVKFVDSGRIYKVSIDGDVTYLGEEDELLTRADITANPESDTTPKLTQEVELTVKTLIDIGDVDYTLVYAWSSSQDTAPADSEFEVADLTGEGRIRTTNVSSDVAAEGNYYLWVRAVVGEIEQETCFGPYAIRDHTMLKSVGWNDSLSDAGFLGNATVKRGLIKSITIQNTLGGHSLADANTWDVTDGNKGKYLAWYEGDEENGYDVTIAGEGGIVANSNSAYLFRNIGSGITDTNIEVTITGLEYLDTGLVTGSMEYMFGNCKATSLNLSNFDTSNVTNMRSMFSNSTNLTNLDFSNFNTSNVIDTSYMFYNCANLTSLDLSSFDTHNVTNMGDMFRGCSKLSMLDISKFDTSNVTSIVRMFYNCTSLTSLDVSNFDTKNVTNMEEPFYGCVVPNLDLRNFDTSNVTNMKGMFKLCKATSINVSSFDTSKVTTMYDMFNGCRATSLDLSNFNTSNVTTMYRMFMDCGELTSLDLTKFNTSKVTNMSGMFQGCKATSINVSSFDTSNVTNMVAMFSGCNSLTQLDVRKFNTSKVTDMNRMFNWCSGLTNIDVSSFNTSNVTNMECMFTYCSNLVSIDLSNFKTNNVTSMAQLFYTCSNLQEANLSGFEATSLTNCSLMFNGCRKLEKIDIRNFEILETCTSYNEIFWYVPTTCNMIVNQNMSDWMDNNGYSSWNNRTIL